MSEDIRMKNFTTDNMTKKQKDMFDKTKEKLFAEYLEKVAAARETILNSK